MSNGSCPSSQAKPGRFSDCASHNVSNTACKWTFGNLTIPLRAGGHGRFRRGRGHGLIAPFVRTRIGHRNVAPIVRARHYSPLV